MKDKALILGWMSRFLPAERHLVDQIWGEMDAQIGNYIRGKAYEIVIVGIAAYLVFKLLGLDYASLLAIMVGLSVLIPYIGAAVVTFPIVLVGYFQWGNECGFYLVGDLVFGAAISGWQRAGADAVFRGGQSAPACNYYRDPGVWRFVGILGGVLRSPWPPWSRPSLIYGPLTRTWKVAMQAEMVACCLRLCGCVRPGEIRVNGSRGLYGLAGDG